MKMYVRRHSKIKLCLTGKLLNVTSDTLIPKEIYKENISYTGIRHHLLLPLSQTVAINDQWIAVGFQRITE